MRYNSSVSSGPKPHDVPISKSREIFIGDPFGEFALHDGKEMARGLA